MSRSKLRSHWMRKRWDASEHRNPHKFDEVRKNRPSRHTRQ